MGELAAHAYLPGFDPDRTTGLDLLGVQARVDFLAQTLASRDLQTPLAIGLFGDWGSGKSFFMRKLQERIAELTDRSAQARADDRETYFCSHVRQVAFNAWRYGDSAIWPSLAAQVFRSVAGETDGTPESELQAEELRGYREQKTSVLRVFEEARAEAAREEQARDTQIAELSAEIAKRREALDAQGADLGESGRVFAGLLDVGRRIAVIVRSWRKLRPLQLLLLASPLVLAAVVWRWTSLAGILIAIAPLVAIVGKAIAYVEKGIRLNVEVEALEERKSRLEEQRDVSAKRRRAAAGELEAATVIPLSPEYAAAQASHWSGRETLGVVTEIRLAFEELSRQITEGIQARKNPSSSVTTTLPIDRVIVYIDDLDRCSHDVVVSVLESIKVLLDLPHFIVVVGVDSRWLFRSIQVHFEQLLQRDGLVDEAWAATPQNYLEKIFQYSLVLRPLDSEGFARLISNLLPTTEPIDSESTPTRGKPTPPNSAMTPDSSGAPTVSERIDNGHDGDDASLIELTPASLRITQREVDFMKSLAPLFETPRAAKRLANVYQLLRVSVGSEKLIDYESYEPVLILLSIAMSFPALAGRFMQEIKTGSEMGWSDFLASLTPSHEKAGWTSDALGSLTASEARPWLRLSDALHHINTAEVEHRTMYEFAEWIPYIADFSFHPWQELLSADTRG
jgi:KAP family P-loop domain